MKVREMTLEDLAQVMAIERENFSVPWTENGFFSFLIRQDTLFLAAEEEGEIAGYCGAVLVPGGRSDKALPGSPGRQSGGHRAL